MARLPNISARECVNALSRIGFKVRRQTGSHIIMQRDNPYSMAVVPNHRNLKPGTLRKIIKDAGLSIDDFVELL